MSITHEMKGEAALSALPKLMGIGTGERRKFSGEIITNLGDGT